MYYRVPRDRRQLVPAVFGRKQICNRSRTKNDVRVNPYHRIILPLNTRVIAAVPCFSTLSIGPRYFFREVSNLARRSMSGLIQMKSRGSSVSLFGHKKSRAPGGSMPGRMSTVRTAPERRVGSPLAAESGANIGRLF